MTSRSLCLVLLLSVCIAMALAMTDREATAAFKAFKQRYNKRYSSPVESNRRFAVYRDNMEFIERHNAEAALGEHSFLCGENEFTDLSSEEFVAQMNGYRRTGAERTNVVTLNINPADIPPSIDWRSKGAVTPVKNQGQCGSCWSFSTTGSTEGAHQISTGDLISLSEQNLIDCSVTEGNQGCQGGQMELAFEYIIKNNGIDTEASYPYIASGPNKCRYTVANRGATIAHYNALPTGSEPQLTSAVAASGPVSVAIDASQKSFQHYSSGVYYSNNCSTTALDHGVLVVGYGASGNLPYYIVKNSWGTTWGLQGYIWMTRNGSNNCGIASDASFPLVSGSATASSSTATSAASSSSATVSSGSSAGSYSSGATDSSTGYSGCTPSRETEVTNPTTAASR